MSERTQYPAGVPCWVETLQPNLQVALDFYGSLFGWEFSGPSAGPNSWPGHYFVARVRGLDIAGIGSLSSPNGTSRPTWITHVRVDSAEAAVEKAKEADGSVLGGPLDLLPAGRMAALTDPAGALICVWEAGSREGAQLVNEPRAWALSALRTNDPEGSKAFYGSVFGWRPETFGSPESQLTVWRLPGYFGGQPQQPVPRDVVGIMTPLGGPGSGGIKHPHWSVDFFVDDADATADLAIALGGRVVVAPYATPGFRSAVLADPQGAVFSVSTQTAEPAKSQ